MIEMDLTYHELKGIPQNDIRNLKQKKAAT
jgi:hypothetical protein